MTAQSIPRPHRPLITPYKLWVGGLLVLIVAGLWGAYQALRYGLTVTNLTDQVPWGLWITLDLSAIALGAGAFTFSAVAPAMIRKSRRDSSPGRFSSLLFLVSASFSLAMFA